MFDWENLESAKTAFQSLPENDISKQYFNRQAFFQLPSGWVTRSISMLDMDNKLDRLNEFYPNQIDINQTRTEYRDRLVLERFWSLGITGALWYGIYTGARRGYVARKFGVTSALFSQYGRFLKTHRVFRQYLWALATPWLLGEYIARTLYVDNVNIHWAVHANRMRKGLLSEPKGVEVPFDKLPQKRTDY